jgi:hypothetical protein
MSTSVRQVSYDLICRMLRSVLRNGVEGGPVGADGIGSIQFRASVALYGLLLDHPIDRLGRCRSCRRPGAVLGRPSRRCRVYMKAQHWLHHPDGQFLLTQLAGELRLAIAGTVAIDQNTTYALPGMESEPGDPPADSPQTPTVPPISPAPAGRPDQDHDRVGTSATHARPRRGPSEGQPSGPGRPLLLTGGGP